MGSSLGRKLKLVFILGSISKMLGVPSSFLKKGVNEIFIFILCANSVRTGII